MPKYFETENLKIRKFKMSDLHQACQNLMEKKNVEHATLLIKSAMNEYYSDEPTWAVEDKNAKSLVGGIRIRNLSPKNKMCNVSWLMSYRHEDTSCIEEALTIIFEYLFLEKDIEIIECTYFEPNKRRGEILDRIGFVREAVLRERRINEVTNEKDNFIIYSINKQEFMERRGITLMQKELDNVINRDLTIQQCC